MRLTIIPSDKAVYKDGVCYSNLTWEGTPEIIHALQWDIDHGWIEFNNGTPNEEINTIPEWAQSAIDSFEFTLNKEKEDKEKPLTQDQKLAIVLAERNKRLSMSDWTELPSVVTLRGLEWSESWQLYRQALRDMPNDPNNPIDVDNPVFPIPPEQ